MQKVEARSKQSDSQISATNNQRQASTGVGKKGQKVKEQRK